MKSDITISELARLMNVSVHQIRYFEEKGVLLPAYLDNNQYRMYSMDQVYQLSHILLLRKLGVPVQSIKECMTSYSTDQYGQLLNHSLKEIHAEILRLQELQHFINRVLHEQKNFISHSNDYQIKWRETTYLARWIDMDSQITLNAKLLTEQAKSVPNLFESDLHFIEDNSSTITLYTETEAPGDFSLPSGNYLSTQRLIHEEDELEQVIEQFYSYAGAQSHVIQGPLILIERSYLSLFSQNQLHYELQALIEPTTHSERGNRS
ncbi:MerR family transcriptional regulator [Brevibacillus sp. HB1.2]|uniref:MerR family transcriptional regulator n=1 Tax=unclassified Brevibacillus TaxID=2684853 RepID=UPI001575F94E|nr:MULTISPECIES: MerR family transcriptional regulator [unclassified Brevibacillus]NTU18829.1 MerR family transcriptional regulator [Brevibacillus sp. HB1.2]NTU29640.1 MerR family transcriptional regulator [Brevibacillus sp. HB1.1]